MIITQKTSILNNFFKINKDLTLKELDLNQVDIYTQESFKDLQNQSFKEGLVYLICQVTDDVSSYFFDASKFVEHCIHDGKITENPLTRLAIRDIKIFASSKEDPLFKLVMTQEEVCTPPNHLPILWNDPSRPLDKRFHYKLTYGKFFEEKEIEKTLHIYHEVAELGSLEAMIRLVEKYKSLGKRDETLKWLATLVEQKEITTKDLFYCAHNFEDMGEKERALKAYQYAAARRNMIGIGEVILQLESKGSEKDTEELSFYRQQLPEEWREKSIALFYDHLTEIKYDYSKEGYP